METFVAMAQPHANDAVAVLKNDHHEVEQLFRRFERTRGPAERKRLASRMVRELSLDGADERFEAKVRVLIDNVRRHVAEEERDLLPALKRAVSPEELRALGDA